MSDVNSRAEELERDDQVPNDEVESADISADKATESADFVEQAPEVEIELPEGANLLQMLIEAQKEAKTNEDGWQRARAEFANYKKRTAREQSLAFQRGTLDALQTLLPIIDDFDRAFDSLPEALSEDPWVDGVAIIQRSFAKLLENYQVEPIDPTGELFDPNFHQAIGAEESDEVESGYVIETLQKGYRASDSVLRLALVKVAS